MTGAILVGGHSRRMQGKDKSLLLRDGERVVAHLAGMLRELCGSCALVAREEQLPALQALQADALYADLFPQCGPLGGLYTVLEETEDDVFLAACDLPFLERPLLERLLLEFRLHAQKIFAVVPRTPVPEAERAADAEPWRIEPLCAIWSRHCRRPAYIALEAGELSVSAFARQVQARYVELTAEEAAQLRNINTREDLSGAGGVLEIL